MTKKTMEECSVANLTNFHAHLNTLLRDNDILTNDTQHEQKRIACVLDSLINVQNQLVNGSYLF